MAISDVGPAEERVIEHILTTSTEEATAALANMNTLISYTETLDTKDAATYPEDTITALFGYLGAFRGLYANYNNMVALRAELQHRLKVYGV